MRAREYSPSQGQFESEDPQAGDQQEPITYDPYEYAGQMPVGITDPSGAGWVFPTKDLGSLGATTDYAEQSAIGGPAAYLGTDAGPDVRGVLESMLGSSAGTLGFWIPVLKEDQSARCQHSSIRGLLGSDLVYNANVVDRATGQFWDIEHADAAGNRDIPRRLDTIARYAQRYGMLWPSADGSYCVLHAALQRGTRFPPKGALPSNAQLVTIPGDAGEGAPAVQAVLVKLSQPGGDGGYLLAWQAADGLIVYQTVNVVPVSASGTVSNPGVMDLLAKAAQAFGKAVAALPGSSFPTSLPEWGRSGTLVHTAIGDYYYGFHRNDALFRNSKSIGKILRSAPYAGHTNPGNLRGYQLRWRPDIVNASWNDLYEIKPVTQYANGIDQMVNYIAAFNQAGVPMNAGPSSDAGVSGVVAAPGGYAVFASPQPGIILYQLMEGDFQPQQAAQPGFAQQLASHSVQDASAVGSGIAVVAGGVWCIITFCWTHPAPATA